GNIRELENVIEHAFVLEGGRVITELSLPQSVRPVEVPVEAQARRSSDAEAAELNDNLDYQLFKEKLEKEFIIRALKKYGGKINQTSAETNISKKTLLRKIEKYKIKTEDFRK